MEASPNTPEQNQPEQQQQRSQEQQQQPNPEPRAPSSRPAPPRKRLTRDQRLQILTIRKLGFTYEFIAKELGVSQRAVQYTVDKGVVDPQHHLAGRRPKNPSSSSTTATTTTTSSSASKKTTTTDKIRKPSTPSARKRGAAHLPATAIATPPATGTGTEMGTETATGNSWPEADTEKATGVSSLRGQERENTGMGIGMSSVEAREQESRAVPGESEEQHPHRLDVRGGRDGV